MVVRSLDVVSPCHYCYLRRVFVTGSNHLSLSWVQKRVEGHYRSSFPVRYHNNYRLVFRLATCDCTDLQSTIEEKPVAALLCVKVVACFSFLSVSLISFLKSRSSVSSLYEVGFSVLNLGTMWL